MRKFRGARPGQVQVTEYHTVEVAPRLPEVELGWGMKYAIISDLHANLEALEAVLADMQPC